MAIPDEYRREMAMAGDWQTLSERPIYQDGIKKEEALDVKPDMISTGIRKRRYEGQEEEEAAREAERAAVRMNWGSTTRTYPEGDGFGDDDLDKLLERSKTIGKGKGRMANPTEAPENTRAGSPSRTGPEGTQACATHDEAVIKREDSGESSTSALHTSELKITGLSEDDDAGSAVVFRKRKAKSMRQK